MNFNWPEGTWWIQFSISLRTSQLADNICFLPTQIFYHDYIALFWILKITFNKFISQIQNREWFQFLY